MGLERQIFIVWISLKRRIDICKTVTPKKLYTQQKLNSLAKEYNK